MKPPATAYAASVEAPSIARLPSNPAASDTVGELADVIQLSVAEVWLRGGCPRGFPRGKVFPPGKGVTPGVCTSPWCYLKTTQGQKTIGSGPFEQLICLLGRTLGMTARGEPPTLNMLGAAALLFVAIRVLGRDWKALLFVGAAASLLGIISDLYEIGHPSELFIALTWMLAARAAQRDAVLLAGLLIGLSAGFETWGLLGAPVLFLIPSFRRTVAAGGLALVAAAAIYAPFALGGDFHMFDLHWASISGIDARIFGMNSPFTWHMRLAEAVLVVGFGSALAIGLRHRTRACVWVVPAATSLFRLVLDPIRYPYYWDTGLTLMLLGTAPWFVAPRVFVEQLRQRLDFKRPVFPVPVD
jgi:hypothetical protein